MEANSLLGNTQILNVHKIKKSPTDGKFPTELPYVLQGVMEGVEYAAYVTQLEKARFYSPNIIPWCIFYFCGGVLFIGIFCGDPSVVTAIIATVGVAFCIVMAVTFIVRVVKMTKKSALRIEEIISEVNRRLFAKGVKWEYYLGVNNKPDCIVVTFFNPNGVEGSFYDSNVNSNGMYTTSSSNYVAPYDLQTYPPLTSAPTATNPPSYVPPSTDQFTTPNP